MENLSHCSQEVNSSCLQPISNNRSETSFVTNPITQQLKNDCDSKKGQARITCPSQVVNRLDKLIVGYFVDFSHSNLFQKLEDHKLLAQELDQMYLPIEVGGEKFNICRVGTRNASYRLSKGDVNILVSKRKDISQTPNVYLEIGSMSSYRSYKTVIKSFQAVLLIEKCDFVKAEIVSRVDLAVDFIGQDIREIPIFGVRHWVKLSRKKSDYFQCERNETQNTNEETFTSHIDGAKLAGVSLGKGNIMLRIYDKLLELKKSPAKKQFFFDEWGFKNDSEPDQVTRCEFQLRREALRSFDSDKQQGINTVYDLEQSLNGLWKYLTFQWTRLCQNPVDRINKNQAHSVVHSWWKDVQNVVWIGVNKVLKGLRIKLGNIEQLMKQATGCVLSAAAMTSIDSGDIKKYIIYSKAMIDIHLRRLFQADSDKFEIKMNLKKGIYCGLT